MKENSNEWPFFNICKDNANKSLSFDEHVVDWLLTPISDLPWSDLIETVYSKSMTRAKKSLEKARFNTVEELIQYLEDRYAQNLSPVIPGFGLGSYMATRYLFESVGFELPDAKFN